ncbi:MAG: rhomboid family intramembrane serine protease [Candidatus Micrarchaeia archaeon]|jgi:membrane associated rhomboid family serine protease
MRFPFGTILLCAAVATAYFFFSGGRLYIPSVEFEATAMQLAGQPWGIVSHLFSHTGLLHLIGNLVPLFAFGVVVETRLKPVEVGVVFFGAGVVAAGLFALFNPSIFLVGASAGISGLIGAAVLLRPKYAVAALVASPLVVAALFPLAGILVELQQKELQLKEKQLSQQVQELLAQNKTAEAAKASEALQGVSRDKSLIESGRKRESETPTDYSVHVVGAVVGGAYVYLFKRKQFKGGVKELNEVGDWLLDLFGFQPKRERGSAKKYKLRRQ